MNKQGKENYVPLTPKKGISNTYQTTRALPSPLSPSKRGINVDALESPTKRLQISTRSPMAAPAPRMNISAMQNSRK